MKVKGSITILGGNDRGVEIEIRDDDANCVIAKLNMTSDDFLQAAMGRMSNVKCEVMTFPEKIGKQHINKSFVFPMPTGMDSWSKNKEVLYELAQNELKDDGWVIDRYLESQNTFFKEDGVYYFRINARKWVDK